MSAAAASWDTSPQCGVEGARTLSLPLRPSVCPCLFVPLSLSALSLTQAAAPRPPPVAGLRLAALSPEDEAEVGRRLAEHGVVYFRDIGEDFTPQRHLEFARRFGGINVNRFFPQVEGHDGIAQVEKTPEQKSAIGEAFHADHTYDLAPALGSMLVARELPAQGGDTFFASMYAAYDSLPERVKRQLAGMRAVHSSRHSFGRPKKDATEYEIMFQNPEAATQDNVHPVVIVHPGSGKKALFVNPGFTLHFEGQTIDESAPLLEALYHHAVRPEHCHRFEWEAGSATMWDNRAVWHCALNDYHGDHRLMHRITIDGVELEAADGGLGSRPFEGQLLEAYPGGSRRSTFTRLVASTLGVGLHGVGEVAAFPDVGVPAEAGLVAGSAKL
jgi:taurine dioxygenase